MNESDPPNNNRQSLDVDRYDRLQRAAEHQMDNIWQAFERHTQLIKNVVIVGGGIGALLIGIGATVFFHDIHDFKREIRDDMTLELNRTTNQVHIDVESRFNKDNIDSLIAAKTAQRVKDITDQVIIHEIHSSIDPLLADIKGQLLSFNKDLSHAQDTITTVSNTEVKSELSIDQVSQVTDIAITTIEANSDIRHSFDKLVQMRDSVTNQYKSTVNNAVNAIVNHLSWFGSIVLVTTPRYDGQNFDPAKASINDYVNLMNSVRFQLPAPAFVLSELWRQDRFPKEQRLAVCKDLIAHSDSLQLAYQACVCVDMEAATNVNILGAPFLLQWVTTDIANITISNSTAYLRANNSDDTALVARGEAYETLREYKMAISDFKHAMELNSKNAIAFNDLAWVFATCSDSSIRDSQRAVSLAETSCELSDWKDASSIDTLATAKAANGDFEEAVKLETQALTLNQRSESEQAERKSRLSHFQSKEPYFQAKTP